MFGWDEFVCIVVLNESQKVVHDISIKSRQVLFRYFVVEIGRRCHTRMRCDLISSAILMVLIGILVKVSDP